MPFDSDDAATCPQHEVAVNPNVWMDGLLFSPCHDHTGLFTERLQWQQVLLGVRMSPGHLLREMGLQINTCYIMHVRAGVKANTSRVGCPNTMFQ